MPKKPAAKKTAAKTVEPMDDGIREQAVGTAATNTKRQCWAIKTLVAEVDHLFPDTPVTYDNYDGRNTALGVTFDFMEVDEADRGFLIDLLLSLPTDERVRAVDSVGWEVKVVMRSNPVTQDKRDTFGLPDAWAVLFEEDDVDEMVWMDGAAEVFTPEGSN